MSGAHCRATRLLHVQDWIDNKRDVTPNGRFCITVYALPSVSVWVAHAHWRTTLSVVPSAQRFKPFGWSVNCNKTRKEATDPVGSNDKPAPIQNEVSERATGGHELVSDLNLGSTLSGWRAVQLLISKVGFALRITMPMPSR